MSHTESKHVNKDAVSLEFQRSPPSGVGEHPNQHHHGMKSRPMPTYTRGSGYPYHVSYYPPSKTPIQSVVTTSFEEEREDGSGRRGHRHHRAPADYHAVMDRSHIEVRSPPYGGDSNHAAFEVHIPKREELSYGRDMPPRDLPPIQENVDMRNPPHEIMISRTLRVPPSPRDHLGFNPPLLDRSFSEASSYNSHGSLKRSFWHHAKSGEEYQSGALPKDFLPPKRSKVSLQGKRDYVVTARTHSEEMNSPGRNSTRLSPPRPQPDCTSRAMSWEEAREEYYHRKAGGGGELFPSSGSWTRSPTYREEIVGTHWANAPPMPSPRVRYSPMDSSRYDISPTAGHSWSPRWNYQDEYWGRQPSMDEPKTMHFGPESQERGYESLRRQNTFDSRSDGKPPVRFIDGPPMPTQASMELSAPPLAHRAMPHKPQNGNFVNEPINVEKKGAIRLLALPEDRISLSETLCIVRENVEVFVATLKDVEAPAPGRKHPVVVGQVGLRCIHCRHTTRSSERVKRAVCYPSSLKRIYRTVIDMKLDHFLHCKFVPASLKETLTALKANNTRSTGTTMQYFIRAATSLGMVDGPTGVRLTGNVQSVSSSPKSPKALKAAEQVSSSSVSVEDFSKPKLDNSGPQGDSSPVHRSNSYSSDGTMGSFGVEEVPKELFTGHALLSLPEDKTALSPLRCFLREQVCAFTATEEDIAVRTPTNFVVSVGQVGITCVHCLNQPAKSRLNRAVCFPFSISRIYQAVADIQRFHLNECKMVPPEIKAKFNELQSASTKGSKGLATRQYWVASAKKIGLIDTPKGIRFCRDPSQTEEKAFSLDILAQVASNVTTVNRPLVLPEDRPHIAEFLYVVMEQLQICRSTDADRNKRRLKDVGCFGVECKHCAGKINSRKFFWSSINAVESNFVSVHTHMMECKDVPVDLKDRLAELKKLRKEQTAALTPGSQKNFFACVWNRLHALEEVDEEGKKPKEEEEKKKKEEENDPMLLSSMSSLSQPTTKEDTTTTTTTTDETIEYKIIQVPTSTYSSSSPENIQFVNEKMAFASL